MPYPSPYGDTEGGGGDYAQAIAPNPQIIGPSRIYDQQAEEAQSEMDKPASVMLREKLTKEGRTQGFSHFGDYNNAVREIFEKKSRAHGIDPNSAEGKKNWETFQTGAGAKAEQFIYKPDTKNMIKLEDGRFQDPVSKEIFGQSGDTVNEERLKHAVTLAVKNGEDPGEAYKRLLPNFQTTASGKTLAEQAITERLAGAKETTAGAAQTRASQNKALGGLSDEAIQTEAEKYNMTGKLPSTGMAGTGKIAILNRASELKAAAGDSSGALIAKWAANAASKSELQTLQNQRGKIMSFADTAEKNLDLVDNLSKKVGRTGVPILNKWILAGKKSIAGDPETAKFHAAVQTAINEYARVTSSATGGGVTSDQARKEVETMLNTAQTPEQITDVIALLRQEIGNRRAGYDDQISAIQGAITGRGTNANAAPNAGAGDSIPAFQTVKEAESAGLPVGTKITIGGRAATVH